MLVHWQNLDNHKVLRHLPSLGGSRMFGFNWRCLCKHEIAIKVIIHVKYPIINYYVYNTGNHEGRIVADTDHVLTFDFDW